MSLYVLGSNSSGGNYEGLINKPKINGVELIGNKTTSELGINIPTKTSELTNDSGFINKDVSELTYFRTSAAQDVIDGEINTRKQNVLTAGAGIKLDSANISVDVSTKVQESDSKPVTSAAVFATLGPIEKLLEQI